MATVTITKWDGNQEIESWDLKGYSDPELHVILQRLVCTTLTPSEVIDASRRRNDPQRTAFLAPVSTGRVLDYGEGIHFTAMITG